MLTSLILFCLYSTSILLTAADSIISNSNDHVDPTEYFTGSQYRPKLEIVRPENGQVLSDGILDIEITISGYELPSHFDESSTCIALSKDKGVIVVEHCFDQSPELIFHVNGLTPGEAYTLRVLFLERGKVIALSVRSFKVGGVIGVLADDENRPVSIQTALQVALRHQVNGMHVQAEQIYQRILSESPSNADALNHLGVNFYQQGENDVMSPFNMEMAQLFLIFLLILFCFDEIFFLCILFKYRRSHDSHSLHAASISFQSLHSC